MVNYISFTYSGSKYLQQRHKIINSQTFLKKTLPIVYYSTLIVRHFFNSFTAKELFVSCSTHPQKHSLWPLSLNLLPWSVPPQKSKGCLPGWSSGWQLGLVCCVLGAEKGLCHPGPGSGCYGSWPDTGKTLQVWNWAEVHSGRAGWALRWKSFRAVSGSLSEAEMTCIIYWE